MRDSLTLLERPDYVHVVINHFPVVGLFVAWLVLLIGVAIRQRPTVLVGLALVAAMAATMGPVMHFGEEAELLLTPTLDAETHAYLHHHGEVAHRWAKLFYATAGVAAVGLVLGWTRRKTLRASVPLTAVMVAVCLVTGAGVAQSGGKIRHAEFRLGPPPSLPQAGDASEPDR